MLSGDSAPLPLTSRAPGLRNSSSGWRLNEHASLTFSRHTPNASAAIQPADGTAGAVLHRGWIDIKSRWRRHDDNAIIDEVERGESITLRAFEDALEGILPPDSRAVIEGLYAELRKAHGEIASIDRVHDVHTS